MTRDDIIKMAKQAKLPYEYDTERVLHLKEVERFAALVAAAEREACAKVCEGLGVHPALNVFNGGPEWYKHGKDCAAAIRARGNT
jgi:hypothetical protein